MKAENMGRAQKPRWLRTERSPFPMRLCCHKSLVPGLYCLYYWQDAPVLGLAGEEWQREYPISLGKVISVEGRWPEKDCKVTVKYCPPSNKKMKGVGSVAQQIMTENSTFLAKFKMQVEKVGDDGKKFWTTGFHEETVLPHDMFAIDLALNRGSGFCGKPGRERLGFRSKEVAKSALESADV